MSKTLFVGLDLSRDAITAQFLDQDGKPARSKFEFPHDEAGLAQLVAILSTLVDQGGFEQVKIAMEATGFYWWHLREYLSAEAEALGQATEVYVVNPSLIKGFKKVYTTLPKTDAVDAWLIADRLRLGRLTPVTEADLRYQPLARLTRFRFHLVKSLAQEKNRACSLLFLKFSEYKKTVGRRLFSKASLAILEEFTLQDIAELPVDKLAEFVATHTNNRFSDPSAFAEELNKAARRSFRLNPKMASAVDVALSLTLENIRFFEAQRKKIDQVIIREMEAIPQTLTSVPGIGPVLAAGIIAETGPISRFPEEAALAKFAGLTWHRHQSGSFEAEETSLTKAGNHYLRYYLVEAANSLRVHNAEYKAFYDRKYAEVPKHQHKRALVLTARKFVRLVFALLSKGQIYLERRPS